MTEFVLAYTLGKKTLSKIIKWTIYSMHLPIMSVSVTFVVTFAICQVYFNAWIMFTNIVYLWWALCDNEMTDERTLHNLKIKLKKKWLFTNIDPPN